MFTRSTLSISKSSGKTLKYNIQSHESRLTFLTFKVGLKNGKSILIDVKAVDKVGTHHDSSKGENSASATQISHCSVLQVSKGGLHGVQHASCYVGSRRVLLCIKESCSHQKFLYRCNHIHRIQISMFPQNVYNRQFLVYLTKF